MPGRNRRRVAGAPTIRKGRVAVDHESWPIELFVWKDANSHWGDQDLGEIIDEPLPKRKTVGFVVHENDERVLVVGTDDRERDSAVVKVADTIEIPPELILERYTLVRKGSRRRA